MLLPNAEYLRSEEIICTNGKSYIQMDRDTVTLKTCSTIKFHFCKYHILKM